VTLKDEYWGEPNQTSLKYASEVHLGKPATDIILLGHAWAPSQTPVFRVDAKLTLGDKVNHQVCVFGNRTWNNGRISPPESFTKIPLLYERAYGGFQSVKTREADVDSALQKSVSQWMGASKLFQKYMATGETREALYIDERNPMGSGFTTPQQWDEPEGLKLPNLENPHQLITHLKDRPTPMGFGFIAPTWQPRVQYAGTYDDTWQHTRAPYMPKDFDPRFFNMAHPNLIYPGYLQGGELVRLENLSERGNLTFSVPDLKPQVSVLLADKRKKVPPLNLETLLIEPDHQQRITRHPLYF